jgi:hypothetical protein
MEMKLGSIRSRKWPWRLPLLALGMISLAAGIWGGLIRMAFNLPLPTDHANWITYHGPLMVSGFLGTVIGLERAVGLQRWWTYAAPLLTGAGALVVAGGGLGLTGPLLLTLGSAVFLAVTLRIVQIQRAAFTITMSLGAAAWVTGNFLWLLAWPFPRIVLWWIAFLGLIILGERLDLSRFQKPERVARPLFLAAVGLFLAGLVSSLIWEKTGGQAAGVGLIALALWLGRFDIARRSIRQPGLPRFMAVCLLTGYVWLGCAGLMLIWFAPLEPGPAYDAALHAFFLGFVFAMIFGHAPIIFPAVLNLPAMVFRRRFYAHVALLHLSLVVRVIGNLADWFEGRQWGGAVNGVAIGLFLLNTVWSMIVDTNRAAGVSRG